MLSMLEYHHINGQIWAVHYRQLKKDNLKLNHNATCIGPELELSDIRSKYGLMLGWESHIEGIYYRPYKVSSGG